MLPFETVHASYLDVRLKEVGRLASVKAGEGYEMVGGIEDPKVY